MYILEYKNFQNRTKTITEEEFLTLLKKHCKNFSFNNDILWRGEDKIGSFGFFSEGERNTIGTYSYADFFKKRNNYIVPRYMSLIGSTTIKGATYFGVYNNLYMVIPFDNSNIVFAGCPDLALWSKSNQEFSDDLFILEKYTKGFKIDNDKLITILNNSRLNTNRSIDFYIKYGFEFFTNSNCLVISHDKVDWLKSVL